MKKIILFLLLSVSLILTGFKQNKNFVKKDIEFKIINKTISDSTEVLIQATNFSKKNYYLLLNPNKLYEHFIAFDDSQYLTTVTLEIADKTKKYIPLEWDNIFSCENKNSKNKFVNHFSRDLFLLKSGESKIFKMPFKIKNKIGEFCTVRYQVELMEKKRNYFLSAQYNEQDEFMQNILSKPTKDSLQKMGYKLYNKQIISNKVPLVLAK